MGKIRKSMTVFLCNLLVAALFVSVLPNFAMAADGDSVPQYLEKVSYNLYETSIFKYQDRTYLSKGKVIERDGNIREIDIVNFGSRHIDNVYTKNTGKTIVDKFYSEYEFDFNTETKSLVEGNESLRNEIENIIKRKYDTTEYIFLNCNSNSNWAEWFFYDYSNQVDGRTDIELVEGIINIETKEILEGNYIYYLNDIFIRLDYENQEIIRVENGKEYISNINFGEYDRITVFNNGNSFLLKRNSALKKEIYELKDGVYSKSAEEELLDIIDMDKYDNLWGIINNDNRYYLVQYVSGKFIPTYEISSPSDVSNISVYDINSIVVYKTGINGWYTIINHDPNGVSVKLDQEEVKLNQGQKQDLTVQVSPQTAVDGIKWTSCNPKIVDVTSNGKVTGMEIGEATVTAEVTIGGKVYKASAVVKVDYGKSDWKTHWGADYIRKAMSNGWVDTSIKFRPNDDITRAEFIKIVNKAFEYTEIGDEPFKDVYPNDWFYNDIRIAVKEGYVTTANAKFRPNDPISREEVAVIVTNILNNKDTDMDKIKKFEDYKLISPWAQTSVEGAVEAGYMGVNVTKFYPISNITRAEAVTTLTRVVEK